MCMNNQSGGTGGEGVCTAVLGMKGISKGMDRVSKVGKNSK